MKEIEFEILNPMPEPQWDDVVGGSRVALKQDGITILQPDHEAVKKMVDEAVAKALRERGEFGMMVYEPQPNLQLSSQQNSWHQRGDYYDDAKSVAVVSFSVLAKVLFALLQILFGLVAAMGETLKRMEQNSEDTRSPYIPKVLPKSPNPPRNTKKTVKIVVNGDNNGNITVIQQ